jgi:chromosome segregation ATPase
MEITLKDVLVIICSAAGSVAFIELLKVTFARWDKWKEAKKQAALVHSSEALELKKLDFDELQYIVRFLDEDRRAYKADAERWRDVANQAYATIREITDEMGKMQLLQRQHTKEIEEFQRREDECYANLTTLQLEIDELKKRMAKVE